MTTSLSHRNKSRGGVLLVLTLLSGGASADKLSWVPTTGGALDDSTNWETTEVCDTSAYQVYYRSLSSDLYLNDDWNIRELYFRDATNTLNLGVGKSLTCTVFNLYANTDVRLTSGTFTARDYSRVGNSSENNRFVITGADTKFISTCSTALTLGHTADDNRMEVLDGATLVTPVRIGYNGGDRNSLLISGQGTVWSNTNDKVTSIGTANTGSDVTCGNSLILADGAEMVNGDIRIGYVDGSWGNSFVLASGAKMTGDIKEIRLGAVPGTWGNSLVVADGGALKCDIKLPFKENTVSNSLVFCGAGTTWERGSTEDFSIGGESGSDYSSFVVSNGVDLVTNFKFKMPERTGHHRILVSSGAKLTTSGVTVDGDNNTIEVTGEGSTLASTGSFYFPKDGGGSKTNVLRIADGGQLTVPAGKSVYISGGAGTGLDLDGGTIDVDGEIDFGSYSKGPTYSRVRNGGVLTRRGTSKQFLIGIGAGVHDTVLEVSDGGILRLADKADYFRIDHTGGYGNALIVDNGIFDATNAFVYIGEKEYSGDVPPENGDRIVVRNGGLMDCKDVIVGMENPYSRLEVENGQVKILKSLLVSGEETAASAANAVMRLAGTNACVTVGDTMTLTTTATLIVDVTGPQVAEAMMTAGTFEFRAGSKIRITSSAQIADDDPDFTATVLKCTGGDIDFSNVTIEVDPNCGLKLRRSAANKDKLVVGHRKKEGYAVILR